MVSEALLAFSIGYNGLASHAGYADFLRRTFPCPLNFAHLADPRLQLFILRSTFLSVLNLFRGLFCWAYMNCGCCVHLESSWKYQRMHLPPLVRTLSCFAFWNRNYRNGFSCLDWNLFLPFLLVHCFSSDITHPFAYWAFDGPRCIAWALS